MAIPYTYTGTMEHARQIGYAALEDPGGVTVTFMSDNFARGFEEAGEAARTFQKSFSSMRSKALRHRQRHMGELATQLDSSIEHPFSRLAVMRNALPQKAGWIVKIIPATMVHLGAVVTFNSTGEVVPTFDPAERTMTAIRNKLFYANEEAAKEKRKAIYPLTVEEDTFARKHDKLWVETARFYGFVIDGDSEPTHPLSAADVRLDDMEDALTSFGTSEE